MSGNENVWTKEKEFLHRTLQKSLRQHEFELFSHDIPLPSFEG
jgi:hypothetical protein